MKTIKRITAIIMALAMIFALGVDVFATASAPHEEPGPFTVTVKQNEHDSAEHTWVAYQIFTGDLAVQDGTEILSNIKWGANIDYTNKKPDESGKTLLQALKDGLNDVFGTLNVETATAADVANLLSAKKDEPGVAQAFADIVNAYLTEPGVGTQTCTTDEPNEEATITGLSAGYYLVKDTNITVGDKEHGAFSDLILEVVHNVTVTAKTDVPSVEKKIIEPDKDPEGVDYNQAGVGENIKYRLSSDVPNMENYNYYWFVYEDTLSKGLTLHENSFVVKVGEKILTKCDPTTKAHGEEGHTCDYQLNIVHNKDGTTAIEIVFINFIQYQGKSGKVVVEYTAELNNDAVIGHAGNPNTVKLKYSNNPNHKYDGDKPGHDDSNVTGETPEDEVKTYTTAVEIIKLDETEKNRLVGAKFTISGMVAKKVIVSTDQFVTKSKEDIEKEGKTPYYKLKTGEYTDKAPIPGETEDKYESNQTYEKTRIHNIEETPAEQITVTGTVGEDGVLRFEGLADGDYIIKEVKAPDGYNVLTDELHFTVKAVDMNETSCNWELLPNDQENGVKLVDNYLYHLEVINKKGIQLPETGGIGTTVFYIVGGALLIAALALLVSKMLASSKKSAKSRAVSENI